MATWRIPGEAAAVHATAWPAQNGGGPRTRGTASSPFQQRLHRNPPLPGRVPLGPGARGEGAPWSEAPAPGSHTGEEGGKKGVGRGYPVHAVRKPKTAPLAGPQKKTRACGVPCRRVPTLAAACPGGAVAAPRAGAPAGWPPPGARLRSAGAGVLAGDAVRRMTRGALSRAWRDEGGGDAHALLS